NDQGQLGNGSTTNSLLPVRVTGLTRVIAVAGGYLGAFALRQNGTVWGWGSEAPGDGTSNSLVPVKVIGLTGVTSITGHTPAASSRDGTVWAWGGNFYGQLGNGTAGTDRSLVPMRVNSLGRISRISDGPTALGRDGTVWAWGPEITALGVLGATAVPKQVPGLRDITVVAGGDYTRYALVGAG
ncbi:RCC1 domain-containing protein, partial [Candidatus Frankia alpina]